MHNQDEGESPASESSFESYWPVARLGTGTTSAIYRNAETGEWIPARDQLHEDIIKRVLAGFVAQREPEIVMVVGGVGAGKSTLIGTELTGKHPEAAVIDADT